MKRTDAYASAEAEVIEPVGALFRRALAEGSVRTDLRPDVLTTCSPALIRGALETTASGGGGIEETAAAVTTLFLRGSHAT